MHHGWMTKPKLSVVACAAALALTASAMTVAPATASAPSTSAALSAASASTTAAAADGRRKKTKIKVDKPSSVTALTKTKLRGKVNGPKRKVILELKSAYGWKQVTADKSNKKGKFKLKVPTGWYGKKKLRITVPAKNKFGKKAKYRALKVTEGYVPLGAKSSWSRLAPGYKTRYNPCQKVKYAINPANLPADGVGIINEAIFRLELATGLSYKFDGSTTAVPFRDRNKSKRYDRNANLAIAWTDPSVVPDLAGGTLAVGGFMKYAYVAKRKTYKLLKTGVSFDLTDTYSFRGFENGSALGAVAMHELTHATGLGHANDDATQLMYPFANADKPALFGNGDLTGLKKSGKDAGCLVKNRSAREIPIEKTVFLP